MHVWQLSYGKKKRPRGSRVFQLGNILCYLCLKFWLPSRKSQTILPRWCLLCFCLSFEVFLVWFAHFGRANRTWQIVQVYEACGTGAFQLCSIVNFINLEEQWVVHAGCSVQFAPLCRISTGSFGGTAYYNWNRGIESELEIEPMLESHQGSKTRSSCFSSKHRFGWPCLPKFGVVDYDPFIGKPSINVSLV